MPKGWISLHRQIMNHELWTAEPFTRGQAWVDLILLANHKDGFIYVRGNKINIKRGQVGWSKKRLSERWGWSRRKVTKFLNDLEEEHQITQQKNSVTSIITMINYDKYQQNAQQNTQQTHSRSTAEAQQKHTNNNVNNENNESEPARAEIDKPTWEQVKEEANMRGITEEEARTYYLMRDKEDWLKWNKAAEQHEPVRNWRKDLAYMKQKGWIRPDQTVNENKTKHTKVEVD